MKYMILCVTFLVMMSAAYAVSIDLVPNSVHTGAVLNVTVDASDVDVYQSAYVYHDTVYKTRVKLCDEVRCRGLHSASISIPENWQNGEYHLRVYDYTGRQWVREDFEVYGSEYVFRRTNLTIPDQDLSVGDTVRVLLRPGSEGAYGYGYVFDVNGRYARSLRFPCRVCKEEVNASFVIPEWPNGRYEVRVYDYGMRRYVSAYFDVSGSDVVVRNTTVEVGSDLVTPGERVSIAIQPGTSGISRYLYVYENGRYKAYLRVCTESRCTQSVNLSYIPAHQGNYCVKAYDYATYRYVSECFTVETINCSSSSDCGEVLGETYCAPWNSSLLVSNYTQPICKNAGTVSSYCDAMLNYSVDTCMYGCQDGSCADATINCSSDDDCGNVSAAKYCAQWNSTLLVFNRTAHTCQNAGTGFSYCTVTSDVSTFACNTTCVNSTCI